MKKFKPGIILFNLLILFVIFYSFFQWAQKESNKSSHEGIVSHALRPDRPDQAILEELQLRSEINKPLSYPQNWRFIAFQKIKGNAQILSVNNKLQWIERGPSQIAGRIRAIVIHPNQTNKWWVGSVGGGIWFTDDEGQSWRCQTDNMPALAVSTIALCDSQPDVLYAGTGEGFFNYDAIIGDGIFKTENGGLDWFQLSATATSYDFRYVNRIVVHPAHPDTLLAATKTAVMRSFDGGQTWEKVFDNGHNVQQIVCNPLNFNSLFITAWKSGIYKSTNLGETWNLVSEAISKPTRIELAISRVDTNYVFAVAADTTYALLGLFKSVDAGKTWTNLGNPINWLNHQGWYNNAILIYPFDPEIVFVGGIDLYKINTKNNAFNYQRLSSWYHSSSYPYVHADQHCIAAIPHPDSTFSLVASNDGGVFFSRNGGNNWEHRNNGLNVTQFYDADRNPGSNQYIGGTQDNGTLVSPINPQKTTKWEIKISGDGFDCAWDDENSDVVFATLYETRIYKSITGGDYFGELSSVPNSSLFHTPLVMDPHNTQKLITALDNNRILITWNSGLSWQEYEVDLGNYRRIRLAISEKDSNIVWVASSSHFINVSRDGGRHFQLVNNPDPNLNAYVTGIATSPFDSATALVMFGVYGYGKIFRTTDLGQSWEDITNNLPEVPVHCALIMPYDSSQIWIGTDLGVFISYNNGRSWKYANQNLPAVAVRRMKIVGKQIVAATHGRGIWTLDNDTLRTYNLPVKEPLLADLPLPNPNTDSLKISFLPQGAYDSLKVFINDSSVTTMFHIRAYVDTFVYCQVTRPAFLEINLKAYYQDSVFLSQTKSIQTFEVLDSLFVDFDDGYNPFTGDFLVSVDSGFSSPTLHTNHPYQNNQEHIALLNNPILISDSLQLSYYDIAIVEPGDPGYFYPYPQMWDYVTVEGSTTGDKWDILIVPYDAREDEQWLTTFKNQQIPDTEYFMYHDTLLSAQYKPGQKIYLRFRLHADAATNGWGWAIDNVKISNINVTDLSFEKPLVSKFQLLGNYPNPFNNSTTIQFTLAKPQTVDLIIYNALGQKIRTLLKNKKLGAGTIHKVQWDGLNDQGRSVGSGIYFYQILSEVFTDVHKMVLLK